MASPLSIFAQLLGSCFAATLPSGATDRHCFTSLYGGMQVQDDHIVTQAGKTVYEGRSIYSATPEGLALYYVNSTGGSGGGTAMVEGNHFDFTMTMRGEARSPAKPYRGRWTFGEGYYDVTAPDVPARRYARVP